VLSLLCPIISPRSHSTSDTLSGTATFGASVCAKALQNSRFYFAKPQASNNVEEVMGMPSHELSNTYLFSALALILVLARLAGKGAQKIGLPSVIGELILGMLLGAFPMFGPTFHQHPVLTFMVELGALILLFEVGLESTFGELRRVGATASRVALVGIMAPLILGAGVSFLLDATASLAGHIFIGATLAATSVGITARVLRDLGQSQSPEAKVILAAAVFDDILGLVLLALVSALVQSTGGSELSFLSIALLLGKAVLFVLLTAVIGKWFIPPIFRIASYLFGKGGQLTITLSLCLALSGLAHFFGLAPIIGAFFAGLLLQPFHFEVFRPLAERPIEDQLEPLSTIFIPLFFVATGMKVDLSVFLDFDIFKLGILISLAAILGKVVSGWAADRHTNRWVIGVGMIPRGEVGIIFAALGASLTLQGKPLFSPKVFGAMIMMVTITSIISPVWLGYLLKRKPTLARERT
jgi:Kef-type K+ transport system membrane component KefB